MKLQTNLYNLNMVNNLSPDQVNVLKDFKRFLDDPSNYMVVSGAAGTGKTTLIQELKHSI